MPKEIWYEELLSLAPDDQRHFANEIALAHEDFLRIAATIKHGGEPDGQQLDGVIAWFLRFHPRVRGHPELWRTNPALRAALHQAAAFVYRDEPVAPTAAGFDPRLIGEPGPERVWTVRQIGDVLRISDEDSPAHTAAPGSPLALLPSTRPIVQHMVGAPELSIAEHGSIAALRLDPATGKLINGRLVKPAWASAWGQNQYGIWVAFTYGEVEQRLRWIPPGRFIMGSPKSEAGRFDDELPHRVTLTQGFWLFDTPVTQALWTAVMGMNPSRFKDSRRPVENVSWDDCQAFIEKINRQIPGLALRLSTEAEWEYACCAGTTAATYAGDLQIQETEAEGLNHIAWYWGNSTGETHPVAQKSPNAWGLYDMLGNVWEWCSDWYGAYSDKKDEIDPSGPEMGAGRVFRGGGWRDDARFVRAAIRSRWHPVDRGGDLGFRCARGQEMTGGGAAGPAPAERAGLQARRREAGKSVRFDAGGRSAKKQGKIKTRKMK
ncbi:MAG: formylglycine-generating enzyme family protein [bacterium]